LESQADSDYVLNLAKEYSLPLTIEKRDVRSYKMKNRCSLEEAARNIRYRFLAQTAEKQGARRIAVGHTMDDNVETILMNILRGTGLKGLSGLGPCSKMPYSCSQQEKTITYSGDASDGIFVLRPLLNCTREETAKYCKEHGLQIRNDSSNEVMDYQRNRVRIELLPLLQSYNPEIKSSLLQLAAIAKADSEFVEEQALTSFQNACEFEDNDIVIEDKIFTLFSVTLQRALLRISVSKLLGDLKDISFSNIEQLRILAEKQVGKELCLPRNLVAIKEYGQLRLRTGYIEDLPDDSVVGMLKVPGSTFIGEWEIVTSVNNVEGEYNKNVQKETHGFYHATLDFDITGDKLFARYRLPGDKFQPLGMNEKKSIQDFMVDCKVPQKKRNRIPLICNEDQVCWVVGLRIDERVKISKKTHAVINIVAYQK
jgi:tRNA(Ile)-lysidine synthase